MADHIRYDLLTQQALRGVVRSVLADAAKKNALPGEHHFYITFDTQADGVQMSPRLRAQYPQEMTIILQHQFWDLTVDDDTFEVSLSFGGVPEHLVVPFDTVKGFVDPSVQFGLQFEEIIESQSPKPEIKSETPDGAIKSPAKSSSKTADDTAKSGEAAPLSRTSKPAAGKATAKPASEQTPSSAGSGEAQSSTPPSGGAEVVSLDRFRKK